MRILHPEWRKPGECEFRLCGRPPPHIEHHRSSVLRLYYSDGAFYSHDSGSTRVYFTTVDGEKCAVEPPFGFDVVNMRKLPAIEVPCSMEMDMNGMQWLRRNVRPFEGALLIGMHLVQSATVEALPGHVDFRGIKRIESSTYAGRNARLE